MDVQSAEITILNECGLYAFHHSIASSPDTARVVTLNQLKNHLKSSFMDNYYMILDCYGSIDRFLKGAGREYMRSELTRPWPEWNYELLTMEKYALDKRHEHNCFSALNVHLHNSNSLLFVFYDKEDKRRFETERAIINKQLRIEAASFFQITPPPKDPVSDELKTLFNTLTPPEHFFNKADSLIKRIQRLVDTVWPGLNYQVTNFGSTANRLCFGDADLDLCIVVPKAVYEQELKIHKNKLSKRPKSVYNMYFLSSRLKEIGMTNVEAIGNASVPICKFVDPQTGFRCDINANNVLGIENTRLIGIYADLDTRVRPLISAIKYFAKQKDINSPIRGTLSSYAYVVMALHFLIAGLENPVIPSLQTLDAPCQSRKCHSRSNKSSLVYFNYKLTYCDTRYHDCVLVHNLSTRKYATEPNLHNNDAYTIWASHNKDSVSELLCQFFEYYSDVENHIVSIYNSQGDLVTYAPTYWNDYIIIQDPFLHTKNIARTCTAIGVEIIIKEFQRAARLLKVKTPFETICDVQYNIPKPVDTESMDYRFNQQKQQKQLEKQQQQQQQQQESQRKDELTAEEYERNLRILLELQKEALRYAEEQERKEQQVKLEAEQQAKKEEEEERRVAAMKEAEERAKKEAEERAKKEAEERAKKEAEERVKKEAEERAKKEAEERAKKEAEIRLKEEQQQRQQRMLEEAAAQREKQQREKQQQEDQLRAEQQLKEETAKRFHLVEEERKKKEAGSPNGSIHALIDKLLECKPVDGASKPCTDMHALLADPLMKDVDLSDIVYLSSQLNFLGSVISEKVTDVSHFLKDTEKTHEFLTLFTPSDFDMNQYTKKQPSSNSSSSLTMDTNAIAGTEELTKIQFTAFKDSEPVVKDMYIRATREEDSWSSEESEELFDQVNMVDIECFVEGVPKEIDNYEIYTQLIWHGRVLEITPSEKMMQRTTWRVHMQVLYGNLKTYFPAAIQLGISETDFYRVSPPVLIPYE